MTDTSVANRPQNSAPAKPPVQSAQPAQQAKPAEAVPSPPLSETRAWLAEYKSPRFFVSPPRGTPWENILKPEYWANLTKLRPGAFIDVHAEDGSYYAELYVRNAARGWAKVECLRKIEFTGSAAGPSADDNFEITFEGPVTRWRVLRKADRNIIKEGLETSEAASDWLRQYKRISAAGR